MPKNAVTEWDTTADNNGDVGGIEIGEGSLARNANDAQREMMAQLKVNDSAVRDLVSGNTTLIGTTDGDLRALVTSTDASTRTLIDTTDDELRALIASTDASTRTLIGVHTFDTTLALQDSERVAGATYVRTLGNIAKGDGESYLYYYDPDDTASLDSYPAIIVDDSDARWKIVGPMRANTLAKALNIAAVVPVGTSIKIVGGEADWTGVTEAADDPTYPGGGRLRPVGALNVKMWDATGDGVTDDTAAIQAAVTFASGLELNFPDGNYVNTATPTGAASVRLTGSPFVRFTGQQIPLSTGVFTANADMVIASAFLRRYAATDLAGSGYTDGETVNLVQDFQSGTKATATIAADGSGAVTGITFVSGGDDYKRGVVSLVGQTSGRSNARAYATVGGASGAIGPITAVQLDDAWYRIFDKSGANHDPTIFGPVRATGSGSMTINSDLDRFVEDPTQFTPAGGWVTPDGELALSGANFGATYSIDRPSTIKGGFGHSRESLVEFDGTSWTVANGGFTVAESGAGADDRLRLIVTRTAVREGHVIGSKYPAITTAHVGVEAPAVNTVDEPAYKAYPLYDEFAETRFEVCFLELFPGSGWVPNNAPASVKQKLAFNISDAKSKGNVFNFNDSNIGSTSNICFNILGARKRSEYPS